MKVSRTCSVRGLWDELNQGLFPWIDDNIGELDAAHRLFMAVCEAVINPREFDYAKWKGNGRPPASRLKIFKAFLLKAVLNVKDTKELARIDPDQPPPPSPITIQGARTAGANMAELPVECEWGCKRDSQGKKKQWKGGKIHAAVTRDGVPLAVKYTSASPHALLTAHARKWARTSTATALNGRIARASFVSDLAFPPYIGKSRVDGQSRTPSGGRAGRQRRGFAITS